MAHGHSRNYTTLTDATWIDLFEGSAFFENTGIEVACSPKFRNAPWLAYYPHQDTAEGRLLRANRGAGIFVSKYGEWPVSAYHVKFIGHHQLVGFGFGHLSASPSEYVVDRMVSIKPIPIARCDV